jgi:hypothetical protein
LDKAVENLGQVRHLCGDYFERLTAQITGGDWIHNDSKMEYCPDVQISDNEFLEVKSCGAGRRTMIYDWRIRKDLDFLAEGNKLQYVLWHHELASNGIKWESEIRREISKNTIFCAVLSAFTMWELIREKPQRRLADRHYSNHYYQKHGGLGYTISLTHVLAECCGYSECREIGDSKSVEFFFENHEAWRIFHARNRNH